MTKLKLTFNWKASILYFFIIQAIIFVISFFGVGAITMLSRFIFEDQSAQDVLFVIFAFLLESVFKFIVFLGLFKNDRGSRLGEFCLSYSLVIALRLIISLVFSFNFLSAGSAINTLGILVANRTIDNSIATMQQVPTALYILFFAVFEALTILVILGARMTSTHIKNREHKQLHGEG